MDNLEQLRRTLKKCEGRDGFKRRAEEIKKKIRKIENGES